MRGKEVDLHGRTEGRNGHNTPPLLYAAMYGCHVTHWCRGNRAGHCALLAHACAHVDVRTYVCVCMHVKAFVHLDVHIMYIRTYVHACGCLYVRMYVCVFVHGHTTYVST